MANLSVNSFLPAVIILLEKSIAELFYFFFLAINHYSDVTFHVFFARKYYFTLLLLLPPSFSLFSFCIQRLHIFRRFFLALPIFVCSSFSYPKLIGRKTTMSTKHFFCLRKLSSYDLNCFFFFWFIYCFFFRLSYAGI